MNLHKIFILNLFCAESTISFQSSIGISQSLSVESAIVGKIIANYLNKYFSEEQIFVSIIFPSLAKRNQQFLDDLFTTLFNDPTMEMIACNFLNKIDTFIHDNIRGLNLILVDGSKSLE